MHPALRSVPACGDEVDIADVATSTRGKCRVTCAGRGAPRACRFLRPEGPQHCLSGRARARSLFFSSMRAVQQRDRKSRARQDRLRLRLLEPDCRLRHQPDSDRIFARGSTYGRAFWVGLLNTLLVAGIGIVLATILGFVVGISRLSQQLAAGESLQPVTSR